MSVRIEAQAEPIPGYKLLDRLGSGGFGEVWRAEAPGGIFKAVKIIFGDLRSQDTDLVRYAEQELKALKRVKQVRHPYLLALDRYDIVDGKLLITMELADCNLWDRFRECRDEGLPGIPRDELLVYMAETAEVLDLMNDQHQLQHLDIKPQNLFLLHHHVKVADFGQVKDLQGVMASVTGGITPVYAAPETFDGLVSRFCDQYSLACVYQELLTGQRPFDGSSMSQLLMQHLQLPPDLRPSPPGDRPALTRALAKKPDERWPNVSSFVRALKEAGNGTGRSGTSALFAERAPTGDSTANISMPEASPGSHPGVAALDLETPVPRSMTETESHPPVSTPAPPEVSGPGPLRPAVVIGIGQAGLRVLQRLRHELTERYGPPEFTPLVRTLFLDTDPDTLDDATRARPVERLAALRPDDVVGAKLNRAGHYLKPRLNGRSLTEGWFDPQLLYRIPRTPQTMGLRLLGRLAFCDHFRPIMGRVSAELDAALSPDALHLTEQRTGLRRRTNRPRVYVVAGTGGGTGGGMFLDVAYAVRAKLKRLGYEAPEVVGVLVVPSADASLTPPQALGNTYAALTELNHYGRPDTTFTAHYDDRNGAVREKDAPFTRCYLLPGAAAGLNLTRTTAPGSGVVPGSRAGTPAAIPQPGSRPRVPGLGSGAAQKPGSRVMPGAAAVRTPDPGQFALKAYADVAELIRLELFTPLGRVADEARAAKEFAAPAAVRFGAFGLAAFDWPRAEVVNRTAAAVARTVLKAWLVPNLKRAREVIPTWAAARWTQLGLDPDAVLTHFQAAAEQAIGGRVEEIVTLTTEPLVPRGWLGRLPEPDKIAVAVDRLVKLFGLPASPAKRTPTAAEEAVGRAAAAAVEGFALDLRPVGQGLVEDPQFRLAGAEEVLRQFLSTTDRLMRQHQQGAADADARAQAGYECLVQYGHHQKGMRKPTAPELTDALRQFPRARYQALTYRQLYHLYQAVRDLLAAQLADVLACRQRVEESVGRPEPDPADVIPGPRRLMPPGCLGVADAVERFLGVLTDADFAEIDRRVQAAVEPEYGGLFQACFHSGAGADVVVRALREEIRAYLDGRLGDVDLGTMFAERFRSRQAAEAAVGQAFAEAEPEWVGGGPWAAAEVVVVAAPGGAAGGPVRELAARAIPAAGPVAADSRDDLTIYREYPGVPLAAVPHLGPAGATAYQNLPEANQCSLHSRLDVTVWADVDKD
jgi:serine/threonine protein kinase